MSTYDIACVAPLRHKLCRRFVVFFTLHVKKLDKNLAYPYDIYVEKFDTNVVGVGHGSTTSKCRGNDRAKW